MKSSSATTGAGSGTGSSSYLGALAALTPFAGVGLAGVSINISGSSFLGVGTLKTTSLAPSSIFFLGEKKGVICAL